MVRIGSREVMQETERITGDTYTLTRGHRRTFRGREEVGSTRGLTTDRIMGGTRRLVDEVCDEQGVQSRDG
jgi:hypothetical protein